MEKYFNPKTKRNQNLFETETLCPVFIVYCRTPDVVIGDKGASVSLIVEACDEEAAKDKALSMREFIKHINMKRFKRGIHLEVWTPTGLYIIGRVDYNEGDPRL